MTAAAVGAEHAGEVHLLHDGADERAGFVARGGDFNFMRGGGVAERGENPVTRLIAFHC